MLIPSRTLLSDRYLPIYLLPAALWLLTTLSLTAARVPPTSSAFFNIAQESGARRKCFDAVCDPMAFSWLDDETNARRQHELFDTQATYSFLDSADRVSGEQTAPKRLQECRACQQCTSNGFSLCSKPQIYDSRRQRFTSSGACQCVHSVPPSCTKAPTAAEAEAGVGYNSDRREKRFSLCYLSSLRRPSAPQVSNSNEEVRVTIEPFWQDDYWRELKPTDVTLYYKFPVSDPEHCNGQSEPIDPADADSEAAQLHSKRRVATHWCRSSLQIDTSPLPSQTTNHTGVNGDARDNYSSGYDEDEKEEGAADKQGNNEEKGDSLPPEVQFERDVFAGAKQVGLHYEYYVKRPRQPIIKSGATPMSYSGLDSLPFPPLTDRSQLIVSAPLQWDLEQELYHIRPTQTPAGEGVERALSSPSSPLSTSTTTPRVVVTKTTATTVRVMLATTTPTTPKKESSSAERINMEEKKGSWFSSKSGEILPPGTALPTSSAVLGSLEEKTTTSRPYSSEAASSSPSSSLATPARVKGVGWKLGRSYSILIPTVLLILAMAMVVAALVWRRCKRGREHPLAAEMRAKNESANRGGGAAGAAASPAKRTVNGKEYHSAARWESTPSPGAKMEKR